MTQEEIFKYNKIIASFMGYKREFVDHGRYDIDKGYYFHKLPELQFNSSWDLLIQVIEKIEQIEDYKIRQFFNIEYGTSLDVIIYRNECLIEYSGYNSGTLAHRVGENKIDAVYKAIVEFLITYEDLWK